MALSRYDFTALSFKSELLLNTMWRSSIDGICLVDRDCRIVTANPAYSRLIGKTESELIGTPFFEVYCERFHEEFHAMMLKTFETRIAPEMTESEYILWDDKKKWFELSTMIVETEAGTPFVLSIVRDRTEHKQAWRATEVAEKHFRMLYENAPLSYQSVDEDGRIVDVNPAWLETFGYERHEVIGKNIADFLAPGSYGHQRAFLPELKKAGSIHNIELEAVKKNGTRFFVSYEGKASFDETGKFVQAHGIYTDITERKRIDEELQQMYIQSRKYAHLKDDLLNEVNHRVKNNLMTILGLLLAEKRRSAGVERPGAKAVWDGFELKINGLLKVHQMLSDSKWAPLNISDLTRRILNGVASIYEPDTGASLKIEQSEITVSPRQANTYALVLNEFMTNSMKHAFEPESSPEICVNFWKEEEMVCVEFSDNGKGYPENVLTGRYEGVGFHMVRQLVRETLRGKLKLSNRGGAVTVMTMRAEEASRT